MIDQLQIGEKYSYSDFGASVRERKKKAPKKKTVKETIPFSNIAYDFSKIEGEVYWEEGEWTYVFEMIADTVEELERKKVAFKSWIMNTFQEKIYDPYIEGYHIIGTFEDIDEDDSEFEKATITVTFKAYPYMISNNPVKMTFALESGVEKQVLVPNKSSHRITPTITTTADTTIKMGNVSYGLSAGEITDETFKLEAGVNSLDIMAAETGCITIQFHEEVF